jgi:hypothetical protein
MATLPEPLGVFTFTGENRSTLPLASKEGASRRGASNSGAWFQRNIAVAAHRLRKGLAGAYRPRRVEVDIFTLKSPGQRQRRIGKKVGFRWPSNQTEH